MADEEVVKTALWQFNEAVSLLREAREHVPQTMGRLTVEIERGLPAIQAALEALAAEVAAGPKATPQDDQALRRAAVAESIYQRHAEGWHAVMHEIIEQPCWNRAGAGATEELTADQVAWMRGEPLPVRVVAAPTGTEDTSDA